MAPFNMKWVALQIFGLVVLSNFKTSCVCRCKTCGEYIYKGKKFNARKEDVENESYLGIRIYRFYIKVYFTLLSFFIYFKTDHFGIFPLQCTRCLSEISFKTDPASTDYVVEAGATRNFMALKLAEEQAAREIEAEKEEERTNPMKVYIYSILTCHRPWHHITYFLPFCSCWRIVLKRREEKSRW